MLLGLMVEVMVHLLLMLMLLLQLWMRLLHRRRRLLNHHRRRFYGLLLLLIVGWQFDRWRIGIGRNDRCSASSSHLSSRCLNHRMMRRWRKMWRIDGLHRTSTGIYHLMGLRLAGRRSDHIVHLPLAGVYVGWWWRMIRRRMLHMGRCLMMMKHHATR